MYQDKETQEKRMLVLQKGEIPASFKKEDKNGRKSKLAQKDTDARWMTQQKYKI